jgi:prepilin-type N-terminal cleavage/methylation domain-containing protein
MGTVKMLRRSGFSLIELVIVVVIIGIIGAIAIPRMSRGSGGAADAALTANLAVLRNAIDLYATEHNGLLPTAGGIEAQLTLYTNDAGTTNAVKGGAFVYGPYLRKVPPLPVGTSHKGQIGISDTDDTDIGWLYDPATGQINTNTTIAEVDSAGVPYNTY